MKASSHNNIIHHLAEAAQRSPTKPALVVEERGQLRCMTFGALWEQADRISVGLQRQGLLPGSRVIVMLPMSLDLYTVLFGIIKMGAVAVFVDPWISLPEIAAFAGFAEPSAFIGTNRSHCLRIWDKRLRRLALTITPGFAWLGLPARFQLAAIKSSAGDQRIFPVEPDTPALITFTTGSSGLPKGANRTHGFLEAQHRALRTTFPPDQDAVDLCMFPVFALNNLACGVTTVIPSIDFRALAKMQPTRVLAQMHATGVNQATLSPYVLDRLLVHAPLPLKKIFTGGAPVSDAQLQRWQTALPDAEIVLVYGSTEAEPVAHIRADERLAIRIPHFHPAPGYCAGRIIPGVEAKIIDFHSDPMTSAKTDWMAGEKPRGEIGELVVSGEHICRDYYKNPEAVIKNKLRDPQGRIWHRMGDTGYLDEENYLWLVGRVHSTIFKDGQALHPALIEQTIQAQWPQLPRVAVVGIPDPGSGMRVIVVVEGRAYTELKTPIQKQLNALGWPVDEIRFIAGTLPLDPRHHAKIDYGRLQKQMRG